MGDTRSTTLAHQKGALLERVVRPARAGLRAVVAHAHYHGSIYSIYG